MKLSDYYPEMQGWTTVSDSVSKTPQVPNWETRVSPFLRTTLPLPLQYSGDTIKQYNRPGMSSFRIAPLPPSGQPAVNSAASGAAASSAAAAIAALTPSDIPAIDLSLLNANGGVKNYLSAARVIKPPKVVTADYITSVSDYYIEVDSVAPVAITLTTFAFQIGESYEIKNINTGVVTVSSDSGNIETQPSVLIPLINQVLIFTWDGTNFSLN